MEGTQRDHNCGRGTEGNAEVTADKAQMPIQSGNSGLKRKILPFSHLYSRILRAAAFLTLFFLFSSFVYAAPLKGPWGQGRHADQGFNPLRFMVELYRTYISPIDGKSCPMYPSCSEYSLLCFEKHGLFIGWVMTCDRLFRCGRDELQLSPEVAVNGELRCYDPVENNDFWWDNGR
jgi:hypothetical protein